MALLTFADTDATAQRLVNAMTELSKQHADANPRSLTEVAPFGELCTETVMLPRDAFLALPRWCRGDRQPAGSRRR